MRSARISPPVVASAITFATIALALLAVLAPLAKAYCWHRGSTPIAMILTDSSTVHTIPTSIGTAIHRTSGYPRLLRNDQRNRPVHLGDGRRPECDSSQERGREPLNRRYQYRLNVHLCDGGRGAFGSHRWLPGPGSRCRGRRPPRAGFGVDARSPSDALLQLAVRPSSTYPGASEAVTRGQAPCPTPYSIPSSSSS